MTIRHTKSQNVFRIEKILIKNNIRSRITYNHKSVSCPDAAKKRNRLGHTGIPLCDELKTFLGEYNTHGKHEYVLLHCRGTQEIDNNKVEKILLNRVSRLDNDHLESLSLMKGLINPFTKIKNIDILQIFDNSVFDKYTPPYTMMTNAGDFNWGIEFYPKDLLNILPNTRVHDIIGDQYKYNFKRHKIGILTGNGPESGIMLWNKINNGIQDQLKLKHKHSFMGDLSFPEVIIESVAEMGLSMELESRNKQTKEIVLKSITNLCESGASLICIACNTTQYYVKEINYICNKYDAQFISMPILVDQYLIKNKIKEFDFLGIKYVADFEKWSAFKFLNDKYTIHVPSKISLDKINDLAFKVKQENANTSGRNKMANLINQSTKTEVIIIALTEISILLDSENNKNKRKRKYIDTLTLVAEEIAKIYIEGISDTLYKRSRQKKSYD